MPEYALNMMLNMLRDLNMPKYGKVAGYVWIGREYVWTCVNLQ